MKISLVPVLQSLRSIYDLSDAMARFGAYRSLMLDGEDFLPLGAFSPMGKNQPTYLDNLLGLGAESIAEKAALEAASRMPVTDSYRLLLVVLDAPEGKNTWTGRSVTDAEWRFENKYDTVPQSAQPKKFDRWVTVQLWTDEDPTAKYIERETQASLYRAVHRHHVGVPVTLADMMAQEGRAQCFAGVDDDLEPRDLQNLRSVLEPHLPSKHYPTCFAAMYGDREARSVGYPELGLSPMAGFRVGLANAIDDLRTGGPSVPSC